MPTPIPLDTGTLRPMLRLALPVLAEQFLHVLVVFSDTILTGHYLGRSELAAINLMNYAMWGFYTVFAIVAIGATAVVARTVGAGDYAAARRVTQQSVLLGVVLALVVSAVGFASAGPAVRILGLEGEAAMLAKHYLWFILAVLLAVGLEEVGIACLRGAGDTVSGLIVMGLVNVVNVAVSWPLVLGLGPLPAMGWYGLAIGTAASHLIGGAIILALLLRGRAGLKLELPNLRYDGQIVRRLLRVGIPGGADALALVGFHLWYVSIINRLGELAMAAHGVGVRIESLSYLPGFAFQVAAATLVGQFLGAGDPRRARRAVVTTCLVGGGVMVAAGVLMFSVPELLARIFVRAEQQDVIDLLVRLLPIVGAAMPAMALMTILTGALRGAGDTRVPLVITFIGLILVRIPLAYWLAYEHVTLLGLQIEGWGLGVIGAWYAMVTDVVIRCILVLIRFFSGAWAKVEV